MKKERKMEAPKLAVTHFNNKTLKENRQWRELNDKIIYNSPIKIKEKIPLLHTVYVIEMNNETNEVCGIGIIKNKISTRLNPRIYEDNNYNRYTYFGSKYISKKLIDEEILNNLETRLFKGKNHLKRSQGICEVPEDVKKNYLKYFIELNNRISNDYP